MKQLILASTFFEAVTAAALVDSHAIDVPADAVLAAAGETVEERILLTANNAVVTELATEIPDAPGAGPVMARFDRVVSLNALTDPINPGQLSPPESLLPALERLLRGHWGLGEGPVELILESPQVDPAIALARIFPDAALRVLADGLMSCGPTRAGLPQTMLQRMTELHYLPLADPLRPRLLHEAGISLRPVDLDAFRGVVAEVAEAAELPCDLDHRPGTAMILGQYLSALGLITAEREIGLHREMIREASRAGCTRVIFKPHPAAPPAQLGPLHADAQELGVELRVLDLPVIAEAVFSRMQPDLVLSCFSTGLATSALLSGARARSIGTAEVMRALAPYENSNRIPLTIVDLRFGDAPGLPDPVGEQDLVDAVSYVMQARRLGDLEAGARATLSALPPEQISRWFRRRKLGLLGLPGRNPEGRRARLRRARRAASLSGDVLLRRLGVRA